MAYSNIDRKRFTYLLSFGTDEFELRKFFSDSRARLIQQGAKVQNLPSGTAARIRALANELPRTTDEVVAAWFGKNLTMIDPEEGEAVVGVFKHYEEVGEELPEESARRYARSCLVHLFSKDPPVSLIEYLKTPIGGASARTQEAIDDVDEWVEDSVPSQLSEALARVLVDLVEGIDTDEHLEGLPVMLATFVTGLQAASLGQTEQARTAAQALPAGSQLRERLEQFLTKREAKSASAESPRKGLQLPGAESFDGTFDYETDEILGYCSNSDRETAVFVRPIAVVRTGQPQFLSDDQRKHFFPETGDVISFPGAGQPRQPSRHEIGVWRVAEHHTEKAAHFHLASDKRPVYEVHLVPFSSTEYDSVREFLSEYAEHAGGPSRQPLLFQLNDGLIVGGRGERADFTRAETFESGLFAWHVLPALRFEGRLFVIGPLPKEQAVYECAGLASVVRKLFRPHVAAGKMAEAITKGQLRELAQALNSPEVGLDALRVQRIKAELEHLWEQREAFDALVAELMEHSTVKQRVDQRVEERAAVQAAQKTNLQTDINRLQKERGEWEERVRKQQAEHRKLRDETSKIVKAAFEKARAAGVSTLAELAIFQALSLPSISAPVPGQVSLTNSGSLAQCTVRDLAAIHGSVISMLGSFGVSGQRASAFAAFGESALKAGLIVCISGVAARQVLEQWASVAGRAPVLIEATIGQLDDSAVRTVLARIPPYDVLALQDANLSALDIYARPISDLVVTRLLLPESEQRLACLFALTDGVASLPLPRTFARVSVSLDLDTRYVIRGASDLDELMSAATDPEEGALYAHLWRPAADRLRTHIEALEPENRAFALSILTAT